MAFVPPIMVPVLVMTVPACSVSDCVANALQPAVVDDLIGAGASGVELYATILPDDGAGVRNGDNVRAAGAEKWHPGAAGHSSGNRDHVAAAAARRKIA